MVTETKQEETKSLTAGKQPVIDLSEMSYEDSMKMAILESKINRLAILQQRFNQGQTTPELLDEILHYSSPDMMEEVFTMARLQMSKVVKWLPENWFVPDADPTASLADPNTYKFLRADKAKELRSLIQKAQQSASKNSEGG